jgi:sugar lactone lactonase YvrE
MRKRLLAIVSLVLLLALVASAGIVSAQGGGTTVAGGFNMPQGVLVAPDGTVWVIDSGVGGETELPFVDPETGEEMVAMVGDTARVVAVSADGTQTVAATLPSILIGEESSGGARLALLDGTLYATSGAWIGAAGDTAAPNMAAVVKIADDGVTEVAQLWELEKEQNPDPFILDSHPYGLTAGPDGSLWVADAGANTLVKVDPSSGALELAAVFAGVPSPLPNPNRGNAMESDPVPTGVAFDAEGNIYVSHLPGFPFLPGSAKVVRVSADGQISDYAIGLTMITDLRTGPDGMLYAVSIGQFAEQGPVPNSGAVIRIKEGDASEVVLSDLSFPTSIDFTAGGDAYVTTNGMGAPGTGELVMFSGVTSMAGTSLAEMAAAAGGEQPASLPATGGMPLSAGWIILAGGAVLVASGLFLRWGFVANRLRRE